MLSVLRTTLFLLLIPPAGGLLPKALAQPAPKTEVRAVWVTTAGGLDWPSSTDPREQQESLRAIVHTLRAANFNTIFFQVRPRGDAYYASAFEPWAQNLTGTIGKDPGWDPLAFLLSEAREAGMEVHAWFNVFKIHSGKLPASSNPPHPTRAFPQWCAQVEGETWLDPGIPGVRAYLLRVAMDLVRRYDIQGLHLDFLRYPGRSFPDDESFARSGGKRSRDEWRSWNLDRFVSELYDSVKAARPRVKVGSAPFGLYQNDPESRSEGAPATVYQNAPGWVRKEKQDYLVPQVYWDTGASRGDPDFSSVARGWAAQAGGRHLYVGIGAYKPEVLRELPQQIDIARSTGAQGESFFRYEHVSAQAVLGGRYAVKALVPPMPWKDGLPPLAPGNLTAVEAAANVFRLDWIPPRPAADGDTAAWFAVYRTPGDRANTADARNIIAVLPGGTTSFPDTIRVPSSPEYTYAVTSLDRLWNESPPSAAARASVPRATALGDLPAAGPTLAVNAQEETPMVGYRLGTSGPVTLEIARGGNTPERLVDEEQDEGMYVVGLDAQKFPPGTYTVTLTVRGETVARTMVIP